MMTRQLRAKAANRLLSILILALLSAFDPGAKAAVSQNDSPPPAKEEGTNATELLRSNLQLQEQLRALQLSIEENRRQADSAAARNAEAMANRLQMLEQSLTAERARDLETVRSSNHVMLVVSGTFAAIGLLAMLLMGYQWRTVSRLAEVATVPSERRLLAAGDSVASFEDNGGRLLTGGRAEASNIRLLGALDKLEKRIHELEHSAPPVVMAPAGTASNVAEPSVQPATQSPLHLESGGNGARIDLLLGKGQSLLSLDKAEEALGCFEQALALDPAHTPALLKKAMALEQLRKLPEAVECYDRALALDDSLTIAYLHKGGLFNRLERFSEALECYEKALRSQDKRPNSPSD